MYSIYRRLFSQIESDDMSGDVLRADCVLCCFVFGVFFFKQKTAYEI